jgi:hypothetical protein
MSGFLEGRTPLFKRGAAVSGARLLYTKCGSDNPLSTSSNITQGHLRTVINAPQILNRYKVGLDISISLRWANHSECPNTSPRERKR